MGNACGKEEEEEGETNSNSTSPEEAASLTVATEHAQQYIQAAFVDQDAAKAAQMLTRPNVKGFMKASVFGDEPSAHCVHVPSDPAAPPAQTLHDVRSA